MSIIYSPRRQVAVAVHAGVREISVFMRTVAARRQTTIKSAIRKAQ